MLASLPLRKFSSCQLVLGLAGAGSVIYSPHTRAPPCLSLIGLSPTLPVYHLGLNFMSKNMLASFSVRRGGLGKVGKTVTSIERYPEGTI